MENVICHIFHVHCTLSRAREKERDERPHRRNNSVFGSNCRSKAQHTHTSPYNLDGRWMDECIRFGTLTHTPSRIH